MSNSLKQSELYAAQDWRTLYQAFTNINFNATDPVSINQSLREYAQKAYPEDFNDWNEASSFVAHIDLLSWLAGTVAFRQDVAARENFLETAESRESILKLARFLSYVPSRNIPLRGLAKIVQIQSDDDLIDSSGNNLNNQIVLWNDPDNLDWYEQFTLIMNSAFIQTNPFGVPLETANIGNIKTQNYRVNTPNTALPLYGFQCQVNSRNLPFELTTVDISASNGFTELFPSNNNSFQLTYRNDGQGFASNNTGFFAYWTQGTLQNQVFNIDNPRENTIIDVNVPNINNNDIWVETIDENGNSLITWTKVPGLFTDNVVFNAVPPANRNIFQVITRDNDQISLKFSDGLFGNIPTGRIRVWYRVSNGDNQILYPKDMTRTTVTIPYVNSAGLLKRLFVYFSLTSSVANSAPSETTEQIRRRANQTYLAQGRMVTGEDYNLFPLQTNLATKIKSVNRTYSGHSTYLDLNDPTGNHNTVNILGSDGILAYEMVEEYNEYFDIGSVDIDLVIANTLNQMLIKSTVKTYMLNEMKKLNIIPSTPLYWKNVIVDNDSSSGVFSDTRNSQYFPFSVGVGVGLGQQFISSGSYLIFDDKVCYVNNLSGNGTNQEQGGIVVLPAIENNRELTQIIPAWRNSFNALEYSTLVSLLTNRANTEIFWDYLSQNYIIREIVLNQQNPMNSILIGTVKYIGNSWCFTLFGLRMFFESVQETRWYFENENLGLDPNTGELKRDTITLLPQNLIKIVGENWQQNKSYQKNDIVYYNNQTFECLTNHVSGNIFVEQLTDIDSLKVNPQPFDVTVTNIDVPDIFIPNNTNIGYFVRFLEFTATSLEDDNDISINTVEIEFNIPILTTTQTLVLNPIVQILDGINTTITARINIDNLSVTISIDDIAVTDISGTVNFSFPTLTFNRDDLTETNLQNNPLKISNNSGEVYYKNTQELTVPPFSIIKNVDLGVIEIDPSSELSITTLWKPIVYQNNKESNLVIERLYEYLDGYSEPRRIIVNSTDENNDGQLDEPFVYLKYLAENNENFNLLFWEKYTDQNDYVYRKPLIDVWVFDLLSSKDDYNSILTGVAPSVNTIAYVIENKTFWKFNVDNEWEQISSDNYFVGQGYGLNNPKYFITENNFYSIDPKGLYYRWKRYAPFENRIDPSVSNIIDIFVLSNEYDQLYRNWIGSGADINSRPIPPTATDLKIAFSSFEQFKMFSDEIVWRPVMFKDIFGDSSLPEYQGKFVVVKNPTSQLSDGEIKSRILNAIAEFFDASRWDFGETFYFQTMSAYVMLSLATHIDSFTVVPMMQNSAYGNLFEMKCNSDELFISTAQPKDIQFVKSNTADILRVGKI